MCWLPNGQIAINSRQLQLLIGKCKSSINGSLQKSGFIPVTMKDESYQTLYKTLPQLNDNFKEAREWTIRQIGFSTPQPELPMLNQNGKVNGMPFKIDFQPQTPQTNLPPPSQKETSPIAPELSMDSINDVDVDAGNGWDDGNDPFCLMPGFLNDEEFNQEFN